MCLPHAGGGVAPFYRWSSWLPPDIRLLPVNLPGRESRLREPAIDDLPRLIEAMGQAIDPQLGGPFAVAGHSMGAMLAFELARRWRRRCKASEWPSGDDTSGMPAASLGATWLRRPARCAELD